ncbi:MAG: carboxypeptidase-like regulatory domain-containing protein [Bacteroidota bacterium]
MIYKSVLRIVFIIGFLSSTSFSKTSLKKIVGRVLAEDTQNAIAYARLSVGDNKIGTLSNEQGEFMLKIPVNLQNDTLQISHIGYETLCIPLESIGKDSLVVSLLSQSLTLEEVEIVSISPEDTILKAWRERSANYETHPTLIQGFYQEEMGERTSNTQVLFAEGILELYKTPYHKYRPDKVRVVKGRQKVTPRVYTYRGKDYRLPFITEGPHLGILLDVMKNGDSFLTRKNQKYYDFCFEEVINHNDRLTYVFSFSPKKLQSTMALFKGKVFIDLESLAVVRARYEVTYPGKKLYNQTSDKLELTSRKYEVNYMEYEDSWYLQDARVTNEYNFPPMGVNLYSHHTFLTTEILNDKIDDFPLDEALSLDEPFIEVVGSLQEEYWGDYNVIPIGETSFDQPPR